MSHAARELLSSAPVLPVLAIARLEDAVPLARTLVEAGLPVLEVTLRTPVALDAIRAIRTEVPAAMVGAGTVLRAEDIDAVQSAGAAFAISPGATDALFRHAASASIPFIPAVATASELMRGMEHGYDCFKFFPARAAGGMATLRAWAGPFADIAFCPTGGIDADSAPDYLALSNVLTVGGSWMVPGDALAAGDWGRISALARACMALQPR